MITDTAAKRDRPTNKSRRPAGHSLRRPDRVPASEARALTFEILNRLDKDGRTLDHELSLLLKRHPNLAQREKRLLNALTFGVLRWRGRLDWVIAHYSKNGLKKIDPRIMNIMRIALFQIIYLSRIPESAAVNTAVELSKKFAKPWTVRFVNAVLRRAAAQHEKVPFPDSKTNPVDAIAASLSFPTWLVKRWLKRFGAVETEALCTVFNTIPPITVRTNTLKTNRSQLISELEKMADHVIASVYAPDAILMTSPNMPVDAMAVFKQGWFQVQDEAAQLVVDLLNPQPGETILDACAGLGGKTGHMAQRMQNKGQIICLDHQSLKLEQLENEMLKLGVDIVKTATVDLSRPLPKDLGTFDRILVDAPCSGLGVIGRNPDTKWAAAKRDLKRYQKRQINFLKSLAPLVKPCGSLVYAVCSFEPEENETVVEAFLNAYPQFKSEAPVFNGNRDTSFLDHKDHGLCIYPHKMEKTTHMDGFFMIRFTNQGKS
jgi:16S rRNA (cytosine967-C5)-methyltransferase